MTKIEKVALAIRQRQIELKACRLADPDGAPTPYEIEIARAAIEEIRNPTSTMVSAGLVALVVEIERLGGHPNDGDSDAQKYMQLGSMMRCGSEVVAAYRAAIDTILKEKP